MMRFDMRAPAEAAAARADRYAAALEMCAWAESRGCLAAVVCEHHASPDGYLPAPMILASAIAARTETLAITIAALLLPLYDPVRLAEEMAVLDLISRGRVSYVLGLGYRAEEYEQFGVDMARRGKVADQKLGLLRDLLAGAPVEVEGRHIHVTPTPHTPGGPMLMWGGGSIAAARRAGRYGLSLMAQGEVDGMQEAYEQASREAGFEPGMTFLPARDTATATFVADDVDRAWVELGPHLLHDALAYSAWNPGNQTSAGVSHARTVDELRATPAAHRILSTDEAREWVARGEVLQLTPLCGGVPPEVA